MRTETKNLTVLIQLALQKRTLIGVAPADLANALTALQHAIDIFPFCNRHYGTLDYDLQQAANILRNLLYLLNNGMLLIKDNGSRKNLIKEANRLHENILSNQKQYSCPQIIQYKLLPVKGFSGALKNIDNTLNQNGAVSELYGLIKPYLTEILLQKTVHCHQWNWWSRFITAYEKSPKDLASLCEILIALGFNTPCFIRWLSAGLENKLGEMSNLFEKCGFIEEEMLKYRTVNTLSEGYIPGNHSVKKIMISRLKVKLQYIARQSFEQQRTVKPALSKLNTVLSVPQLALLVRLMVETKILNEISQVALLKNVAACTSTSKAASISFESLRINYYTPAAPAKNIVKEYLLQMLRLVNTY